MSMSSAGAASQSRAARHERRHRSVLADVEKRVLIAIAECLPPAITSDLLSAVGLTSMLIAGAACAAFPVNPAAGWVVVAALAANWFGDSLDGTVARVRRQQRPRYGFYVDHVIDLAGTTALMTGLSASGLMHPSIALLVLIGFLLASAESYLSTISEGVFRMSFLGVGPTELRILLAAGALRVMWSPWADMGPVGRHLVFDVGGIIAAAGLGGAFVWSAVRQVKALREAEPLPLPARGDA